MTQTESPKNSRKPFNIFAGVLLGLILGLVVFAAIMILISGGSGFQVYPYFVLFLGPVIGGIIGMLQKAKQPISEEKAKAPEQLAHGGRSPSHGVSFPVFAILGAILGAFVGLCASYWMQAEFVRMVGSLGEYVTTVIKEIVSGEHNFIQKQGVLTTICMSTSVFGMVFAFVGYTIDRRVEDRVKQNTQ